MLKIIASLVLDLAVALAVILNVYNHLHDPKNGKDLRERCGTFRFFTTDSNILCALSCLITVPFLLADLGTGVLSMPVWVHVLRYAGTVAVTVTFLTVMFFLGPTCGYKRMLSGSGLWLHLICPVLTLVSFVWTENCAAIPSIVYGFLPVFVYGLLYLYKVVYSTKNPWEDFYGFNKNGKWGISLAAMFAGALVICFVLRVVRGV